VSGASSAQDGTRGDVSGSAGGSVPAPALRETAEIWWDSDSDPLVEWDAAGRVFTLVDAADERNRLALWRHHGGEPAYLVGRVLAEHLAACDFPPTGEGASPGHVRAALRAAGIEA
jgi:hypothetical protein